MAWARIDDRYCFHRKVLAAGNEAAGAHVRMIAYACLEGTDGVIAAGTAMLIAGSQSVLDKLGAAELLERTEGGDYVIHDFLDYNPPAAEVKAKREAVSDVRREAGRKGAAAKWRGKAGSNGSGKSDGNLPSADGNGGGKTMAPSPSPSPSPSPIPISNPGGEGRERASAPSPVGPQRGSRLRADWEPSPNLEAWCRARGVDAKTVRPRFVDYWIAESGARASKRDWDAAFRTWVSRDLDRPAPFAPRSGARKIQQPNPPDAPWLQEPERQPWDDDEPAPKTGAGT